MFTGLRDNILMINDLKLSFNDLIIVFDCETGGLFADNEITWNVDREASLKKGDKIQGVVKNHYTPILEIAGVRLNPFTLEEEDTFYSLCGPEEGESIQDLLNRCEEEAFKINNLNNKLEELEKAPALSKVIEDFVNWSTLSKQRKNFIPSGQNVKFDIDMVNATCKRFGIDYQIKRSPLELRSYSQFYFALPDTPIVANYKLTTIAEALGISTEGAHEALEDVRMTSECLKIMFKRFASN